MDYKFSAAEIATFPNLFGVQHVAFFVLLIWLIFCSKICFVMIPQIKIRASLKIPV